MSQARDIGRRPEQHYPADKRSLRVRCLLTPLLRAGLIVCLVTPLYSAGQAPEPKAAQEIDRSTITYCRLPAQTRKMSSRDSYTVPGKVVRISAGKCKERGGTFVRLRPAKTLE